MKMVAQCSVTAWHVVRCINSVVVVQMYGGIGVGFGLSGTAAGCKRSLEGAESENGALEKTAKCSQREAADANAVSWYSCCICAYNTSHQQLVWYRGGSSPILPAADRWFIVAFQLQSL